MGLSCQVGKPVSIYCISFYMFLWANMDKMTVKTSCGKKRRGMKFKAGKCWFQEPRLHARCVHGLLECNEASCGVIVSSFHRFTLKFQQVELAVDLGMAWRVAISVDMTQQLEDAAAKREVEHHVRFGDADMHDL